MGRKVWALAAAWLAAAALAGPAAAGTWYRAETDRFIVYGEHFENRVREYATKLQTFDALLRVYHPSTIGQVPATKLQLVLVNGPAELRRVRPDLPDSVAGFYTPNNEGIFAFVITDAESADHTLFHEYAHHFMLENFPVAYPAWFVEGFAEYFSTVRIKPEGIRVGDYSPARVSWIVDGRWVPLEDLLGKAPLTLSDNEMAMFYAEAWLLTHYMRSDPERAKQLDATLVAIAAGEPPVKAFEAATGRPLAETTKALRRYRTLPVMDFKGPTAKLGDIKVTSLPDNADDFLLDNIRLFFSSPRKPDALFLAGVRRKAQRRPDDLYAQMTLARAEFVMGDPAAGAAIAGKLLAAHPEDQEVVLLAGMGELFAGDRRKEERTARYRAARTRLMKAYALDNQDFRPLYAYARTRVVEPNYPSEKDIEALAEARALAPAVKETSLLLGQALIKRGRRKEAETVLAPLLNSPHGGGGAKAARAILAGEPEPEEDEEES